MTRARLRLPDTRTPPTTLPSVGSDAVTPHSVSRAHQQVLVERNGTWYDGEIVQVQAPDQIRIHYTGWGTEWDESVPRARLRLPKVGVHGTHQPI